MGRRAHRSAAAVEPSGEAKRVMSHLAYDAARFASTGTGSGNRVFLR
jgi:hypothetical protein